jgi:hypothetical protein
MRVLGRLRRAPKAPLAVAAIVATPLFFVTLMALSLRLEEPTVEMRGARDILGDPTAGNETAIWLLSFVPSGALVLVGVVAMLLPGRIGVAVPALGAIGVTTALLLPLDSWESEHTVRFPQGVDLIPQRNPGDLILRGEWEENARRTAEQIGFWTIAIAVAAIGITVLLEIRRRRGIVGPPVPPPPEVTHPPT